jgi:hypothetical protein
MRWEKSRGPRTVDRLAAGYLLLHIRERIVA